MHARHSGSHDFMKQWDKLVAQAWFMPELKQRLLVEPVAVMRERGMTVPAGARVKIHEADAPVRATAWLDDLPQLSQWATAPRRDEAREFVLVLPSQPLQGPAPDLLTSGSGSGSWGLSGEGSDKDIICLPTRAPKPGTASPQEREIICLPTRAPTSTPGTQPAPNPAPAPGTPVKPSK